VPYWLRDLIARHHARISRPKQVGRPRTIRSIRRLVLRIARENSRVWLQTATPVRVLYLAGHTADAVEYTVLSEQIGEPLCDRQGAWRLSSRVLQAGSRGVGWPELFV
jgi:hypothetical protein